MKKRNGSALLIVLGMLAFMIVSAVAFAAYMRFARLPSSYLRRTSASRLLAKAALARVVDEIDQAVAGNPHPGVGGDYVHKQNPNSTDWQDGTVSSASDSNIRNVWKNRVFVGTNVVTFTQDDFSKSVPVLSAEALAYIPPALVNEARYYGRLSPAARWHQMDFDAGRYAFCALDVSDFFDINRTLAATPRSSASNQRVSISHLFENQYHTQAGNASEWDNFTADYDPTQSGKVPFTSYADFLLAYKDKSIGNLSNPVYKFLTGDSGAIDFNNQTELEYASRMLFVTDSLFTPAPPPEDGRFDDVYDLSDGNNQPFDAADLATDKPTIADVALYSSDAAGRMASSISRLGLCTLWDYLDPDHLPISLALPTVERVPMVVGLEPSINNAKVSISVEREPVTTNPGDAGSGNAIVPGDDLQTFQRTVTYKLNAQDFGAAFMSGRVNALVAYPFAHEDISGDPKMNSPFKLDGRFAYFFSVNGNDVGFRTRSDNDVIHFGKFKDISNGTVDGNGVIVAPFAKNQTISISPGSSEESVLQIVNGNMSSAASGVMGELGRKPILTVTYQWQARLETTPSGLQQWVSVDGLVPEDPQHITSASSQLPPLKSDGTVDNGYTSSLMSKLKESQDVKLKLNAAVWLRVLDKNGDTVDMAPACMQDDQDLNNIQNNSGIGSIFRQKFGDTLYPLLKFSTGVELTIGINALNEAAAGQGQDIVISPSAIMCPDPRFNHAPESWMEMSGGLNKNTWLDKCGAADRDGDIFMATSDAGYLQSIYELAHLTRFTNMRGTGKDQRSGDMDQYDDSRTDYATDISNLRNGGFMWNTYRSFATGSGDRDNFEDLGFTSAGTGFKVNPYSDATNVIMSAFANTPLDWRVSGTNDDSVAVDMDAYSFNRKYAWNEFGGAAEFKWNDLAAVAGNFMKAVRGSESAQGDAKLSVPAHLNSKYWEDAFDGMDWQGANSDFCGVDNLNGTPLWSPDRKFLYGFWRDCFAARQQLFLVFIRAEPSMLGGEAAGAVPPQLGSRAVALVWRDPDSGTTAYPHQTRVLFYKPLD